MTSTSTTHETRVQQLMAERAAALRAGDAERVVAQYAPDAVVCDLAPPLRRPADEVCDPNRVANWLAGFAGPVDVEFRDLTVTAGDDVAFCHGLARLTATPRGAADAFTLWYRITVGLRLVDGDWRITHEHESTPFHMDGSFRAAVDLEP
ncbi:conserved hypothetical protein [Amycolatopsis arida]|uniref:SnoaL-like domain-containing protein n=1 Tax=Amycolatopsis arida TaxID=587909 RepID=A0A1I5TTP1_9PSEU|nr:nuclear transport factor 2 family protein [Amycolatopsis arida]TDX95972.1 uncharacterized protein (TIGR02246 family) [Amycolatopsis arida]SFP86403.1 conserved hypothetical protein [Amycolatopsis arida]